MRWFEIHVLRNLHTHIMSGIPRLITAHSNTLDNKHSTRSDEQGRNLWAHFPRKHTLRLEVTLGVRNILKNFGVTEVKTPPHFTINLLCANNHIADTNHLFSLNSTFISPRLSWPAISSLAGLHFSLCISPETSYEL